MEKIKLFIGSSSNGEDSYIENIYEYSLRKNCSKDLEITWMRQNKEGLWSHNNTQMWSTPFSGFRWFIPEICNFKGRAIYTDCDMINFKDMASLFETDMRNKPIAARKGQRFGGHEFCVMLFDCERIKDMLIPITRQKNISEYHHRMIHKFSGNSDLVEDLDPRWNCLDGEDRKIDDIWQLHWTKMSTQPWKPGWFTGVTEEHPRKDLVKLLEDMNVEAKDAGYTSNSKLYEDNIQYGIIGQ